ncbi:MAG: prenyltransferase/squalene oxidase repeat-containing protein [Anaerolineae bacterium]
MTWVPLLLADRSPCLRLRVLRDLLGRPDDDPEVRELAALVDADPLVSELADSQEDDGSWSLPALGTASGPVLRTAQALARLGTLGLPTAHHAVQRAAEYLYGQQREDGSWPLVTVPEEHDEAGRPDMIPLQTALPLRGLAAAGFATDPRAERAYDWLLAQRLDDGAWPTGLASGDYRYVAGYRRLPHSRWGCRSNTTGALLCLAHHPERRYSPGARRALDHLLGRETREAYAVGFDVARLIGAEPVRGFLTTFARYDLGLLAFLCARIGAGRDDERVAALADDLRALQGPFGLWEYAARPQASRWVTFDLLLSLSAIDAGDASGIAGDWVSLEPRTPFAPYRHERPRY